MAEVKSYARLWPLAFAAIGAAGLGYAAWQWTRADKQDVDIAAPDATPADPGPTEHYEKVRLHYVDVFTVYRGEVKAGGVTVVRAPQGMRVPIVKVHHEPGESVRKGDVLVSFFKPQIDEAIEKAKRDGRSDDEQRFRGYLDFVDLKAPCDGVVGEIQRDLGQVPIDDGIGIVTLVDEHAFRFIVQVPGDVQRLSMSLGTKFDVDLDDDKGSVAGAVVEYAPPVAEDVPVVIGLEPHEGIQEHLSGAVRVKTGRQEAGLVPKSAIQKTATGVAFVRTWDAAAGKIAQKTVKLGDEVGEDVVVLAGVFTDDSVLVPGAKQRLAHEVEK
jgi:hypothetical protein